jgi:hypothetical protein
MENTPSIFTHPIRSIAHRPTDVQGSPWLWTDPTVSGKDAMDDVCVSERGKLKEMKGF